MFFREDHYFAASSSAANSSNPYSYMDDRIPEDSLVLSENLMFLGYRSISNDDNGRKPNISKEDEAIVDVGRVPNHEDVEHRMDLTDDLLHMVLMHVFSEFFVFYSFISEMLLTKKNLVGFFFLGS